MKAFVWVLSLVTDSSVLQQYVFAFVSFKARESGMSKPGLEVSELLIQLGWNKSEHECTAKKRWKREINSASRPGAFCSCLGRE